jgi:acetyl-CoA carboxylase biotin carboxyl carrier protein
MSLRDNLPDIAGLIELMREHDVARIDYEDEETKVSVRFGGAEVYAPTLTAMASPMAGLAAPASAGAPLGDSGPMAKSPMVGTFYRSPEPSAPPFVSPGDRVHKGDVLCIIEAMKLMNEIEAEIDGVVAEVLVDNGQAVQFGQPLFRFEGA